MEKQSEKEAVMMKCGHAANSMQGTLDGNFVPCCAICVPKPEAFQVATGEIDLSGRIAKCRYCGAEMPSSLNLPFFSYNEKLKSDSFYCGCWGWD
jgi:hypothetical protein